MVKGLKKVFTFLVLLSTTAFAANSYKAPCDSLESCERLSATDTESKIEYATGLIDGRWGKQDKAAGKKILIDLATNEKAARAIYQLGLLHAAGTFGKDEPKKAYEYLLDAAYLGISDAQFRVAKMSLTANGTALDPEAGFKWALSAAKHGHTLSQNLVADLYFSGTGTTQNYKEALKWYKRSALRGISDAQFNLGMMYYIGQGTTKNVEQAMAWLTKSSSNGNTNAKHFLSERDLA